MNRLVSLFCKSGFFFIKFSEEFESRESIEDTGLKQSIIELSPLKIFALTTLMIESSELLRSLHFLDLRLWLGSNLLIKLSRLV